MDDVKAAGLKGIKEFKTDAVDKKTGEALTPGATEIVLGFFKGPSGPKDIEVRFYSNNKNYGHYTYDHLISHQISGDVIEINYKNESGKNLINSIKNHDH